MEERIHQIHQAITILHNGKPLELVSKADQDLFQWRFSPDFLQECIYMLNHYQNSDECLFHSIIALKFVIENKWDTIGSSTFNSLIPILLSFLQSPNAKIETPFIRQIILCIADIVLQSYADVISFSYLSQNVSPSIFICFLTDFFDETLRPFGRILFVGNEISDKLLSSSLEIAFQVLSQLNPGIEWLNLFRSVLHACSNFQLLIPFLEKLRDSLQDLNCLHVFSSILNNIFCIVLSEDEDLTFQVNIFQLIGQISFSLRDQVTHLISENQEANEDMINELTDAILLIWIEFFGIHEPFYLRPELSELVSALLSEFLQCTLTLSVTSSLWANTLFNAGNFFSAMEEGTQYPIQHFIVDFFHSFILLINRGMIPNTAHDAFLFLSDTFPIGILEYLKESLTNPFPALFFAAKIALGNLSNSRTDIHVSNEPLLMLKNSPEEESDEIPIGKLAKDLLIDYASVAISCPPDSTVFGLLSIAGELNECASSIPLFLAKLNEGWHIPQLQIPTANCFLLIACKNNCVIMENSPDIIINISTFLPHLVTAAFVFTYQGLMYLAGIQTDNQEILGKIETALGIILRSCLDIFSKMLSSGQQNFFVLIKTLRLLSNIIYKSAKIPKNQLVVNFHISLFEAIFTLITPLWNVQERTIQYLLGQFLLEAYEEEWAPDGHYAIEFIRNTSPNLITSSHLYLYKFVPELIIEEPFTTFIKNFPTGEEISNIEAVICLMEVVELEPQIFWSVFQPKLFQSLLQTIDVSQDTSNIIVMTMKLIAYYKKSVPDMFYQMVVHEVINGIIYHYSYNACITARILLKKLISKFPSIDLFIKCFFDSLPSQTPVAEAFIKTLINVPENDVLDKSLTELTEALQSQYRSN